MRLVEVGIEAVESLTRGEPVGRPTVPGWPHADTLSGLGFVRDGGSQFLVIDDDGRVAGECGTKAPPNDEGRVEIGYGLAPGSRGHGLGARAVAELLRRLAEQSAIRVVEAEVHESNTPSRRVVERLGFTVVDTAGSGYLWYRRELRRGG